VWSVGSRSVTIYLGMSAVAWRSLDAKKSGEFLSVLSFDAALQVLESQNQFAARQLDFFLSSAIARPFLVPGVQGMAGPDERLQLARAICSEGTGFSQPSKVWVEPLTKADETAGRAALAVAMEESTWVALHQLIKIKRWKVRSIRPVWTDALALLAQSRPSDRVSELQWMGCVDTDSMTILSGHRAEYSLALTRSKPDAAQLHQVRVRAIQSLRVTQENAVLLALNEDGTSHLSSHGSQCLWRPINEESA
jgi:hypothetical protein